MYKYPRDLNDRDAEAVGIDHRSIIRRLDDCYNSVRRHTHKWLYLFIRNASEASGLEFQKRCCGKYVFFDFGIHWEHFC